MNIKGGVTSTKFAGAVDSINHLDAFIKTGDNEEILVQLEELKDFIENDKELSKYVKVSTGVFGSDMEISFTNIGPVTIIIEK